VFTPTEGAAVGALGTGLVALANGGLTRATLATSFFLTARTTAMIFFIVLGAAFYNGFLALTQVPQEIAAWVVDRGYGPWTVLILILLFYLLLGCLMDSLSMILLTIPIFWPVVQTLDFGMVTLAELHAARAWAALDGGVVLAPDMLAAVQGALARGAALTADQSAALGLRGVNAGALARINAEQTAIWFGILVLVVVEVGLITPPVGMNLFVINGMDRQTPIGHTYRAVLFFVASDLLRVAVLLAFPAITLFLVGW
jgi:C4-dicarboxylate transporter DctM subunit